MNNASTYHITLLLGWEDLGDAAKLRRNTTGFDKIKGLVEKAENGSPLKLNAFFYTFLFPAKNFDLILRENTEPIAQDVQRIAEKMDVLEDFERDAIKPKDHSLQEIYLKMRHVAARRSARDERRALATLLFSGPSTGLQVAQDLGISENLAKRVLSTLAPCVSQPDKDTDPFVLCTDLNYLAVTLYLLRYTLGIDPIRVLHTRI
jgi:hypothetical protein